MSNAGLGTQKPVTGRQVRGEVSWGAGHLVAFRPNWVTFITLVNFPLTVLGSLGPETWFGGIPE